MKLDDLLVMVGDRELTSLPWGASAITLTNSLLDAQNQLAPTCTGNEALAKLRGLSFVKLSSVITMSIQIEGNTVSFIGATSPTREGVPTTVPAAAQKVNPLVMLAVIVMSVVAVGLTYGSIKASGTSGQQPESDTIEAVVKTLSELAKSGTSE